MTGSRGPTCTLTFAGPTDDNPPWIGQRHIQVLAALHDMRRDPIARQDGTPVQPAFYQRACIWLCEVIEFVSQYRSARQIANIISGNTSRSFHCCRWRIYWRNEGSIQAWHWLMRDQCRAPSASRKPVISPHPKLCWSTFLLQGTRSLITRACKFGHHTWRHDWTTEYLFAKYVRNSAFSRTKSRAQSPRLIRLPDADLCFEFIDGTFSVPLAVGADHVLEGLCNQPLRCSPCNRLSPGARWEERWNSHLA